MILTALGILLGGFAVYQLGTGELIEVAGNPCRKVTALTAPTLAQVYSFSESLAKTWKADAALERLDHLGPLQANGSATDWTVGFYSAASNAGMLIHTGNGKLFCSVNRAETYSTPALSADFTRDGAALYALAEKHGRALLENGYGVRINLWTAGDHHAMWHVTFALSDGSDAGTRLVVDANTGRLEEIVKQ
jgi:hypothetical protein